MVRPRTQLGYTGTSNRTISVNDLSDNASDTTTGACSSGGDCTLREAINLANSDGTSTTPDVITFAGGGTVTLAATMPTMTDYVVIEGPSGAGVTLDGAHQFTVLEAAAGELALDGLTIANGNGTCGGSSYNYGGGLCTYGSVTVSVSNSTFLNNFGVCGGAIFSQAPVVLTVADSTFVGNTSPASNGGAVSSLDGTLTVDNSTFVNNSSPTGAAIYIQTGATLSSANNVFEGNRGYAVYSSGGTVTSESNNLYYANTQGDAANFSLSGTDVTGKDPKLLQLGSFGGPTKTMLPLPGSPAICAGSSSGVPGGVTTDQRGFLLNTSCVDAGAVQTNYLAVTDPTSLSADTPSGASAMADINLTGLTGTVAPGALTINGQVNIIGPGVNNLTISGNNAYTVFTINSGATAFLYGLTVANGNAGTAATFVGGGISNAGTLTVSNDAFTSNSGSDGGAIETAGTLIVTDSTFSGNSAPSVSGSTTWGWGGAITVNTGTATVTNSTFADNSSAFVGGGIYNQAQLTVINSTFSGNTAAGAGGAVENNPGGALRVSNSIFSGNTSSSSQGAGIGNFASVTENNNVFYNNTGGDSNGFTLSGTDVTGKDTLLAASGSFGGLMQTMLPLPGSAAICAGSKTLALDANLNPLTTDQRGFQLGASSYCASGTVDAGAVQTNYTSIQFDNAGSGYSAVVNQSVAPAPVASVTENNQNIGSVPVTLSFSGTGTATGLGPVATGSGTGATFSSLSVNAAGNDTLSATLQVTPTYSIITNPNADLNIQPITTSLTATPSSLNYTYGTAGPSISVALLPTAATGIISAGFTASIDGTTPLTVIAGNSNAIAITGIPTILAAGSHSIVINFVGTSIYASSTVNVPLIVTQAASATTLAVSSASTNPGQAVTLTATVASTTTGTPTGTVSFYDGTNLLGTGTLAGGTANLNTTALTAGATNSLTASYSGDIDFTPSSTTASIPVVVAPLDFTLTLQGSVTQTVIPGSSVNYQLVINPIFGSYAGPVSFTASGLPTGATATFSPATIGANGGQQTVTATIQTPALAALNQAPSIGRRLAPLTLALLVLPLAGAKRIRWRGRQLSGWFCLLLVLCGVAAAVTGCGSPNGFFAQVVKSYDVTITATAGGLQHSTIVTVEVQ
jgi:CSLREA domain-containing protein